MHSRPNRSITVLVALCGLAVAAAAGAQQPPAKTAARRTADARAAAALAAATAAAKNKHGDAKAPAAEPANLPKMDAQQVVERYVAARGGAAAWKAVTALEFKGKLGAGGSTYEAVTKKLTLERREREEMQLPFVLQLKRPARQRMEVTFNGQTAVQVFDGKNGYKYRPFLNRTDWTPFTPEELKASTNQAGIDGWLIDYAAKGTKVESAGAEMVEGQGAYKLKVTTRDGRVRHAWIDGKTFLEVKEDGEPRKLDTKLHDVTVFLRDYRAEQGLLIPHVIETVVQGVPKSEKVTIESVTVNPALDDSRFAKGK